MQSVWLTTNWASTFVTRGGGSFDVALLEHLAGFVVLRLEGKGAASLCTTEPGGHRWQQASGKKGQIHTSTITVAVMAEPAPGNLQIAERDVDYDYFGGSGAGGQNRNKTMNCVRAVHRPTGIEAKCESERSLKQNKAYALAALAARVQQAKQATVNTERAAIRKGQVGTGQRGDKVRTIRYQDGIVTCERTGRKHRLKEYLRGDLDWLTA